MILGESGDVLEALTRVPELAEKYVGNVKLVYIDPPFNTAKAFTSYEDNLEHSVWLTMMRDRLLNLRRLLSDDGMIWLHIDDVEVHRMRMLLDEVFGTGNFMSEIAWEKTFKPRNDKKEREGFSSRHDIILVYAKSQEVKWNRLPRTTSMDSAYSNPDNDPKGPWTSAPATANKGDGAGGMCYAIQSPLTGEMLRPPRGGHWRFGQQDMLKWLSEYAPYHLEDLHDEEWRAENEGVPIERVKVGIPAIVLDCSPEEARRSAEAVIKDGLWPRVYVTGGGGFRSKSYLATKPGRVPEDWWPYTEVGSNDEAKNEIKNLFPDLVPFDTPKPERLLERIIYIATNPGDIVFDCFAGSGTTVAVAQKMGRRWVTCELLESNFKSYTLPRLTKVVNDEDPGGVTSTEGERVAADGVELPDNVSAKDAYAFNSVLNKVLKRLADDAEEDGDETAIEAAKALKKSNDIKRLKELTKTRKTKADEQIKAAAKGGRAGSVHAGAAGSPGAGYGTRNVGRGGAPSDAASGMEAADGTEAPQQGTAPEQPTLFGGVGFSSIGQRGIVDDGTQGQFSVETVPRNPAFADVSYLFLRTAVRLSEPDIDLSKIDPKDIRAAAERITSAGDVLLRKEIVAALGVRLHAVDTESAEVDSLPVSENDAQTTLLRLVMNGGLIPATEGNKRIAKAFLIKRFMQEAPLDHWTVKSLESATAELRSLLRTFVDEALRNRVEETEINPLAMPSKDELTLPIGDVVHEQVETQAEFVRGRFYGGWFKSLFEAESFDSYTGEYLLAKLLNTSPHIVWWQRLHPQEGAYVYYNAKDRYFPDFVARDDDGVHWIIEGKDARGRDYATVQAKRGAAESVVVRLLGDDRFTDQSWGYLIAYEDDIKASDGWGDLLAKSSPVSNGQ